MTAMRFASPEDPAIPLTTVTTDGYEAWRATLSSEDRAWVDANRFKGGAGAVLVFPGVDGSVRAAAAGLGGDADRRRKRFVLATVRTKLPPGLYRLETDLSGDALEEAALAWLLAGYRFSLKSKPSPTETADLIAPDGIDPVRLEIIASGEALTRDLINRPASDLGPAELVAAGTDLAEEFGASVSAIMGDALLDKNFPLIHAVGRASSREPGLFDLRWGEKGPALTLVGKGIVFDTGGLNLKPGGSMALMKKDMGGAATVLGLARMIMALDLPLRLRVLIPTAENAVSGPSFRPGDVLTGRNGLTVEINNTDAEGRLVLADALSLATEEDTDLLISMATLTGAARVAVGPDLAPFFTDDDAFATALSASAQRVFDPVWRLPFWDPYETMIEPQIADLDNSPSGGMAGAITAALFLRRFAAKAPSYAHFDIYGWQPTAAPGRPKGGVGMGARAILDALPDVLGI